MGSGIFHCGFGVAEDRGHRGIMPFIKYTKRPEKGPSSKAWDLFVKKYGTPTSMIFHALCQKPPYWAANINGKIEIVKSEEIK